ncbi:hypothetical protein D1007_46183 [Hordeum vulgare]|uniref:Predicted protein n=1 Tax=Hordeum vulgare subsp. vulgare TaxID=112509 RepID=F2EJN0_HORVV|nr:uncharacterized protein LOC123430607 [Hordeum vulgare subsp. vulgare]KAE8780662.1 hypothetical protein D1007_46183 [Hordeum vulgare]KAI5011814.1 hypothetical protein ZWY2020_013951 [Hordeum vulgare]BAK07552.1 predicted protein [Hordeum vulgare subsp. vulgare]
MAQIHLESMQTAVPTRVALERGRTLPIAVTGPPIAAAELQHRFRVVLYYHDRLEGDAMAQLEQAAWVQESLSAALADHPKMAGRLWRRRHAAGRGDGPWDWDVKLCDAGVRLLMASVDTTLTAFLEAEDRESKEPALALWTDVEAKDPEKCSPFVMQLTRFHGGGYAIGACCSLLHADPLSFIDFLKSWARTHAQLQAQDKLVPDHNQMLRYTHYFRNPGAATRRLRSTPLVSVAGDAAATVLFRVAGDAPDRRALAEACVAQASEKLGVEKPTRFTVLAGDGLGGLNVLRSRAGGDGEMTPPPPGHLLRGACWQEAGLEEAVLDLEGCKPVHVSCSIVSPCAEEGIVVVMQAGAGAELWVSATVPSRK